MFAEVLRERVGSVVLLSEAQVAQLEQHFELLQRWNKVLNLTGLEKVRKEIPPRKVSYHRQYVGFTRDGERYIYGNFYPGDKEFSARESKSVVMVCDGGQSLTGSSFATVLAAEK